MTKRRKYTKPKKKYTKAEKLEIVSQSFEEGHSIKDLAERYGINENTLYNWRSLFYKHHTDAFPGHGNKTMTESEREIAKLKKQLRESELEKEILKKAISIFSKGGRKF